jgi:cyanate permease
MKLSKKLHKFSIITVLFLVVFVSIIVIDNYNNSFEFYKNTKTFFLSIFIVNILIISFLKKYQNSFLNKPLTTFCLCLLTFSFLALFINKLIFTGFENEIILYNQISSIIFGFLSFILVIYQHYYNLKIEKNVA